MIDLNSITISEEKLGTFGDLQLKGGVVLTHTETIVAPHKLHFQADIKNFIEKKKLKIKRELWKKLYGDLYDPIQELKSLVKEYLLEPAQKDTYQYHPFFLNSSKTEELINKIDNLLQPPE